MPGMAQLSFVVVRVGGGGGGIAPGSKMFTPEFVCCTSSRASFFVALGLVLHHVPIRISAPAVFSFGNLEVGWEETRRTDCTFGSSREALEGGACVCALCRGLLSTFINPVGCVCTWIVVFTLVLPWQKRQIIWFPCVCRACCWGNEEGGREGMKEGVELIKGGRKRKRSSQM